MIHKYIKFPDLVGFFFVIILDDKMIIQKQKGSRKMAYEWKYGGQCWEFKGVLVRNSDQEIWLSGKEIELYPE